MHTMATLLFTDVITLNMLFRMAALMTTKSTMKTQEAFSWIEMLLIPLDAQWDLQLSPACWQVHVTYHKTPKLQNSEMRHSLHFLAYNIDETLHCTSWEDQNLNKRVVRNIVF